MFCVTRFGSVRGYARDDFSCRDDGIRPSISPVFEYHPNITINRMNNTMDCGIFGVFVRSRRRPLYEPEASMSLRPSAKQGDAAVMLSTRSRKEA